MAFELGATSTSDFTDRVTHLIANSHGGAKYMVCFLAPQSLLSFTRVVCARAQDTHHDAGMGRRSTCRMVTWRRRRRGTSAECHHCLAQTDCTSKGISKHRLPIFSGVVLSLSGIEDIHRRFEINRLVTAHQGTYVKDLERPVRVTHLLCSGDTETEKMKYAEKFNKRKEAHIHLVWEEWFWDSLEYGGASYLDF